MRDYTKACDNLYPLASQMRLNPAVVVAAYPLALEVRRLKINLVIWCTTVLYGLAAQGVTMPKNPLFRTDTGRVVTYRPGGPQQGPPRGGGPKAPALPELRSSPSGADVAARGTAEMAEGDRVRGAGYGRIPARRRT